jgi:hypothetical protein
MSDTSRDDLPLPLPGYDQLPLQVFRQRLRALDEEQLLRIVEHESAHADRPLVQEMLRHRLDELRSGAEPTDGPTGGATPQVPDGTAPTSRDDPSVASPSINPPSQGDPTNPAQPR